MSAPLYTIDILRLAASVADFPPLAAPDAREERRSTVCGSRIAVDLTFGDDGRVSAVGLAVHACALGQASAAVLADAIIGSDAAQLAKARDALTSFLAGAAETAGDWPGIDALASARDYPARHPSIRLAFETAAAAASRAKAAA